ncbi:MAG: phosphoglucosamine mutase, partial [bacterium]|nr:phosphoglucosamine mutase [bacterium]
FLIAKFLLEKVPDFNRIVVGTVMGNLGLEKALQLIGVSYLRTDVGDKYVYREMKAQDAILGGEQSGHTILRAFQKTGDGILTALYFLEALFYFELSPSEVFDSLHLYPQVIRNVKIREKRDIGSWVELTRLIRSFEDSYGDNSRVLIRYSGTEPKIRVMIESEHQAIIDNNLDKFVDLIRSTIGEN